MYTPLNLMSYTFDISKYDFFVLLRNQRSCAMVTNTLYKIPISLQPDVTSQPDILNYELHFGELQWHRDRHHWSGECSWFVTH